MLCRILEKYLLKNEEKLMYVDEFSWQCTYLDYEHQVPVENWDVSSKEDIVIAISLSFRISSGEFKNIFWLNFIFRCKSSTESILPYIVFKHRFYFWIGGKYKKLLATFDSYAGKEYCIKRLKCLCD